MHFDEDWANVITHEDLTNERVEQFGREGFMKNIHQSGQNTPRNEEDKEAQKKRELLKKLQA
jgi:hypothetical protein